MIQLFSNDLEAVFVRRPNRFLVIAEREGREIPCHCPNPGRLIEFFGFRGYPIPGARLILEKRASPGAAKTAYTAAGLYYRDRPGGGEVVVPLISARANRAAKERILQKIIPGLAEVRAEYTLGGSRFDFLCTDDRGRRHLVEVKACSLVEYGAAMFPDAPSGRALKHLEELAARSREGFRCHLLFVIVHSRPEVFIPNFHTDPAFAAALSRWGTAAVPAGDGGGAVSPRGSPQNQGAPGERPPPEDRPVLVHAALLRLDRRGGAALVSSALPVDLRYGALAERDGGSYLMVLELKNEAETAVGSLGRLRFRPGWYVYAGSARKNLRSRMGRHQRKVRKRKRWHLDYLTPFAETPIRALPVRSFRNLECDLAGDLLALGGEAVKGFGSSDCTRGCPGHLYYFSESPLLERGFGDLLFKYRHREAIVLPEGLPR
ncbi:MAG: DNA/RNA nuclease SfsA [Treponema sp.]|jgi:sugar fermentation stimulation protein A|nr:DNA/RNA nuclease SfsA [Treponema sp.]